MSVGAPRATAPPARWPLGVLALANLLAAVGGGRVLSAARGGHMYASFASLS